MSTEKYPLPDGWRWVRLGEVCKINPPRPKNFTRASDAPTIFIPMSAVDEKTGTVPKSEVVHYSKVAKGYTYFEENDVLFAKITPCMQNGKHTIARNLIDRIGFGTTEFHVLRAGDGILPEWIWYFIRQTTFLQEAIAYFTGAVGQQRVPESFLSNYFIPLPHHLEVQRRITAKLQKLMREVECARTACEKQLEAAKALPNAYLRDVFESEEAKKWERKRLGEVCKYDSGIWGDEPDGSSECYFVLRSNNIKEGKMIFDDIAVRRVESRHLPNKLLKIGDILVTTSSGSKDLLGKSAIFIPPDDKVYLFSNFTMRLRSKPEIINCFYLFFYLQSHEAKNVLQLIQDTTTGLRNLDRKEFLNQSIPFPPLSEQHRITAELKQKMAEVEKLRTAIEKQLEAISALPQAILRKAFNGEL